MAACYDVPHDIVESILSRLPVKSLIRFKGVCKQWSATISDDPKLAETYLQRSNTLSSSYLQFLSLKFGFGRIQLDNNEFRKIPTEEYLLQLQGGCRMLGSCDGIFLLSPEGSTEDYVVWNPSTRTHREVRCPHPIDGNRLKKFGICYDPLMKDYKAVICDAKHYAVYYCRSNSWSELKEMKDVEIDYYCTTMGVHFKGSIYWILRFKEEEEEGTRFEIICFDGRDEKLENYGSVDCNFISYSANLISSRDCLYFIPTTGFPYAHDSFKQMVVMKKVGHDDPWTELSLELPFPCVFVMPLCSTTRENQIMLTAYDHAVNHKYIIYVDTKSKGYATQIQSIAPRTYHRPLYGLYLNLENLLLL